MQKRRVSKKLSNSAEISKEIPYNEIKIEILIENVKTSVILDTGSQTNLISRKTLNQITKNWQPLPEQTERCGVGVGGKPFKFVLTILNVTLNDTTLPLIFAVTDLPRDDILMGIPFMAEFGMSIKMSPEIVEVKHKNKNIEIVNHFNYQNITLARNVNKIRIRRKQFKFVEIKTDQYLEGDFLIEGINVAGGVTQLVQLKNENKCKIGFYNNSKRTQYFARNKIEFRITRFDQHEGIKPLHTLLSSPDTLLSYLDRCSFECIDGLDPVPCNSFKIKENKITKDNSTGCVEGELLPPEVVEEILNHLPGTDFKFKGADMPIEEIIERDLNKNLPEEYREYIKNLLIEYPELVPRYSLDAGLFKNHKGEPLYLEFPLKYSIKKNTKPYFLNTIDKSRLRDILDFLLFFGLATECSEYEQFGSPVFLNQNNPMRPPRLIVDVRGINECINCPVSTPPDCLIEVVQKIGNDNLLSCIDLKNAYYSIMNSPEALAQGLSNMITPWGAIKLNRAPTGCSQLPVFWRTNLVRELSKSDNGYHKPIPNLTVWYDDLIVGSENRADHYKVIKELFHRLHRSGLKINLSKSKFFVDKRTEDLEILGFTLSKNRVIPQSKKLIQSINFKKPTCRRELQQFLGHVCFLRDVMPLIVSEFCSLLSPLTSEKKEWKWEKEQDFAFENVKELLNTVESNLSLPIGNGINIIYTDASSVAIGGIAFRVNFSEEFAIDKPENLVEFDNEEIVKCNENLGIKAKSLHYLESMVDGPLRRVAASFLQSVRQAILARNPESNINELITVQMVEENLIETVYAHLGLVQQLFNCKEDCEKFFDVICESCIKGENDALEKVYKMNFETLIQTVLLRKRHEIL